MKNQETITPVKAEIKDINNSNNPIYSKLFCTNEIVRCWAKKGMIFKSWSDRYSKHSDNSFCLVPRSNAEEKILTAKILVERFGISNPELFKSKYCEAVSGNGQEWRRITTLHSSSLIALLCFYNVTSDHPLSFLGYTFTASYFEVKTDVPKSKPSNMDIVLRGKDDKTGRKVVLFLESKFSEYLSTGKYDCISSEVYGDTYKELELFSNPIPPLSFEDDGASITISSSQNGYYCGGIKQMISHYIGVSNYSAKKEKALSSHAGFKSSKDEDVILAEILFQFPKEVDKIDRFSKYKDLYNKLAKRINEGKKLKMLEEVISYQDIFNGKDYITEDIIRQFYGLQ